MRALPFTCAALSLTLAATSAAAHALLVRADPRVGSAVAKAPQVLTLTFTEGVVASFSRVTVSGPAGAGRAGAPHAVAGDPTSLALDLKGPAPAGLYTVHWRVLAVDTHVTQGSFTFQVKP
jgi:methionine-rich copper-binding protein CopC